MGNITLPKDSTFSADNLLVLGQIPTLGISAISLTGKLYNIGKITGDTLSLELRGLVYHLSQNSIEELQKLGIPIVLSKGKIYIPEFFFKKHQ